MKARLLSLTECEQIYKERMVKDFPADELKPLASIVRMVQEGFYKTWGFYENDSLAAYAFLCDDTEAHFSLLDYYAVNASLRGRGYGQEALSLLRKQYENYAGLIIESENPDFAKDEEDGNIRKRRIHFYEKCGLTVSGVRGRAFGVEYKILYAACNEIASDEAIQKALAEIYRRMLPEEIYEKEVVISFH